MSNRLSNIIFYCVIFFVTSAFLLNSFYPEIFENLQKSNKELIIEGAITNKEYDKAIATYQELVRANINNDDEITEHTAALYENIAAAYAALGNSQEHEKYLLKSIAIKKQLKKVNIYNFANTYYKLASIYEDDQLYDKAQSYYEKALLTRLGDIEKLIDEENGMFLGMQHSRTAYLRTNHADTISTFKKLANIHYIKKEHTLAKEYYQKALAASINTFGAEDSKTLALINSPLNKTP